MLTVCGTVWLRAYKFLNVRLSVRAYQSVYGLVCWQPRIRKKKLLRNSPTAPHNIAKRSTTNQPIRQPVELKRKHTWRTPFHSTKLYQCVEQISPMIKNQNKLPMMVTNKSERFKLTCLLIIIAIDLFLPRFPLIKYISSCFETLKRFNLTIARWILQNVFPKVRRLKNKWSFDTAVFCVSPTFFTSVGIFITQIRWSCSMRDFLFCYWSSLGSTGCSIVIVWIRQTWMRMRFECLQKYHSPLNVSALTWKRWLVPL